MSPTKDAPKTDIDEAFEEAKARIASVPAANTLIDRMPDADFLSDDVDKDAPIAIGKLASPLVADT